MQLLPKKSCIGAKIHRHGWPYVVDHIRKLETGDGVVFDDFIEQTFNSPSIPHLLQTQPWTAMAHVPPDTMRVFSYRGLADYRSSVEGGEEAFDNLVGLCTMSHYMANRLRQVCDVPVDVIHYPTDLDVRQFDIQSYLNQPQLVHVGWCRKNLLLLEHIPPNPHIHKKIYVKSLGLPEHKEREVRQYCSQQYHHREVYKDVEYVAPIQQHEAYDALLEQSVVAVEFLDCAATTVVVEALARHVPILVNRHPALIEYLGEDYPMFFDDIQECTDLLHPDNIVRTHHYIQQMDKDFLCIDNFMSQFSKWIQQYDF